MNLKIEFRCPECRKISKFWKITGEFKAVCPLCGARFKEAIWRKDEITLKGERALWIKFVNKLREEKKQVWEVLSKFIEKYLKGMEK